MRIKLTQADGRTILRIEGDLRIDGVADAKQELSAALAAGGEFQLDLGGLGECDTAGMQLLLMTSASARANGRRCATIGHTPAFRAALDRIGIPAGCFDFTTAAPEPGADNRGQRRSRKRSADRRTTPPSAASSQ
jgi:anti-anti-sigma regulatory factor